MYIDKFDMPDFLITYSQVGKRAPMTCTGVGKAMLAFLPWEYVEKHVLTRPFAVKTVNSIDDSQKLKQELSQIAQRGFAVDNEEIEMGLRCVAAPIFDHRNHPVAAVSVSGMSSKMTEDMIEGLAEDIKKCAADISFRIGCRK